LVKCQRKGGGSGGVISVCHDFLEYHMLGGVYARKQYAAGDVDLRHRGDAVFGSVVTELSMVVPSP
jgi:hypothetical protein